MIDGIVEILRSAIGLDASSIGLGSIERAVQHRMEAAGVFGIAQYQERVRKEPAELSALIEEVVVPETWFFRDPGAFSAAAEWARRASPSARVRFLSVPCATGEEPYSLAMALLDAAVSPERFEIEAVDVSDRVLEHAAEATYGRNSFRGGDLGFRERYFRKSAAGYVLDPVVQGYVSFRQANLLEDFALHLPGCYSAIFCRNLLIYFDAKTQVRVLERLAHLLAPEGLLFVAPSESGLVLRHGFTPAGLSQSFAFYKTSGRPKTKPENCSRTRPKISLHGNAHGESRRVPPAATRAMVQPVRAAAPAPENRLLPVANLSDAVRLADEGRFAEVSAICHSVIQTEGASADVYYLLALVSDASNHPQEAATFYRKALYLDPRHRDALLHFSLLAGRMGDTVAANALRQRAHRLETDSAAR